MSDTLNPWPRSSDRPGLVGLYLDLALVWILSAATVLLVSVADDAGPLSVVRVVLGVCFVFFVPGYAIQALLFPMARSDGNTWAADPSGGSVGRIEAVVLSVGLSIAVVPLVALVLSFSPWGATRMNVVFALTVGVAIVAAGAAARRTRAPSDERFSIDYVAALARVRSLSPFGAAPNGALNLLVAVSIVLSAGLAGATLTGGADGETYTEFALLTESDTGELVADDYPSALSVDRPTTFHVGISNYEGAPRTYTVVVLLQRLDGGGVVTEQVVVDRYTTSVDAGASDVRARSLRADGSVTGSELRLTFLLYAGSPPEDPSRATAYRATHVWVEVTSS